MYFNMPLAHAQAAASVCQHEDAFVAKIALHGAGPGIALGAVTDAAGYRTVVSPGEIVSIFGSAMAVTPATATGAPLPGQLSDVRVSVNGVAAPLFYVFPVHVNAQVPFETAIGPAQIQVTSSAGAATLSVQVAPAAPGIFTVDSRGGGAGAIEHGIKHGIIGRLVTDKNPATAGEIISIYCTGLGAVNLPRLDRHRSTHAAASHRTARTSVHSRHARTCHLCRCGSWVRRPLPDQRASACWYPFRSTGPADRGRRRYQ